MKKFFKKLKKAWKSFNEEEKVPVKNSLEDILKVAENVFAEDPQKMYEMKMGASVLARSAHMEQNKQIDAYFDKIMIRTLGESLYSLYRDDRKPIPNAYTNIEMFMDQDLKFFGRRVRIYINDNLIGDAIFEAHVDGMKVECIVKEKIS